MKILPQNVVTITYQLFLKDGAIVEEAGEENPFSFIIGIHQTLPGFDKNLLGLSTGDVFEFLLDAENGFGEIDDSLIVNVPNGRFEGAPAGTIELHKSLPMLDEEGNTVFGVITEIGTDSVTMDFNHPLSGEDLIFKGKILKVRRSSLTELELGRVDEVDPNSYSEN